jgi:hypothetical protein
VVLVLLLLLLCKSNLNQSHVTHDSSHVQGSTPACAGHEKEANNVFGVFIF